MFRSRSRLIAFAPALVALAIACSSSVSAPPAADTTPALPAAAANTSGRKEVAQVAGPRQRLVELYAALQKNDIPGARRAMEAFNSDWNGIEVYVNFRSRPLYGEIEAHYEADITKALEGPSPNPVEIMPLVRSMVEQYDQAIKLSDTGPAISPLFDDLAVVRTVRAPLRTVSPALKAGDLAKAKTGFDGFKVRWSEAQPYFKARSTDAFSEADAALTVADKAMAATPVSATIAGPLVDALLERYNYGVNLLNAAARNADIAKTSFTEQDVQSAASLAGIMQDLKDSLSAWEGGNYAAATAAATRAAGQRFESVSPVLQAKNGADAPLKKALDTYTPLAAQAGEAAKVRAAEKAAVEAAAIAQQVVAGQFWTDSKFQEAYQKSR